MYIPYGKQDINQTDIDAVLEVLHSDFLTQGPAVPAFEKAVSEYCKTKYVTAVNSATSALHLACRALDLGPGDYLWTSPITFVASANCGLYCGAKVDFVDIDPDTYNLCPEKLEKKLILAKKLHCLPKIVVPVHLCGQSCSMQSIYELSKHFGFKIIEDASHAIGGMYKGEPVGDCRYSDITIFSFHPVKIITTAEGGAALTNDESLDKRLKLLRSHGITRDPDEMTQESEGPWYYQQIDLGYNYRLTDLQAALGITQLKRLDDYVKKRHQIAERYNRNLFDLNIKMPYQHTDCYSSYHLYVIRLKGVSSPAQYKQIFEYMRLKGVGVNLHYIPVHTQPYYRRMGFEDGQYPEAEKYYREAMTLPLFPTMSEDQQSHVETTLKSALK